VEDHGCGITEEQIGNLFVDFGNLREHQGANPSGRGLGLSICKSIIKSMGGEIRVESKPDIGTSFIMSISLKTADFEEEAEENTSSYRKRQQMDEDGQLSQNRAVERKMKLLIVNDEEFLIVGYEEALKIHFDVETARNGLEAVNLVKSHPSDHFDVVVLDINMPIMNGFDAC